MIRFKRRNTAWLVGLAFLTFLGLAAAPAGAVAVQFALLAIFTLSAIASVVELGRERETLIDALRRAPIRNRVSPQAREAAERARSRGGYSSNDLVMLDVGLIAAQSSYEGMAMRKTRNVSKDDDGVRPYVTFNVEATEAERNANIRFEIYNHTGQRQFVHEVRTYLREGEISLVADHHLPLAGNSDVGGTGDWDLRVYVDGNLVGMHNFMLAPSTNERHRRLTVDAADDFDYYEIVDEVEQEVAPRLQDLLVGEQREQEQRRATRLSEPQEEQESNGVTRSRTEGNTRRSRTATRRRR